MEINTSTFITIVPRCMLPRYSEVIYNRQCLGHCPKDNSLLFSWLFSLSCALLSLLLYFMEECTVCNWTVV